MARDPVCGMEVAEEKAAATTEYGGTTYYFCSRNCKSAFERDPEKYAEGAASGHHAGHRHT